MSSKETSGCIGLAILAAIIYTIVDLSTGNAFIAVLAVLAVVILLFVLVLVSPKSAAAEKKKYENSEEYKRELRELKEKERKELQEKRFALLEEYKKECESKKAVLKKLNGQAKRQKLIAIGQKYFGANFDPEAIDKEITRMEAAKKKEAIRRLLENEKETVRKDTLKAELVGLNKRLSYLYEEAGIEQKTYDRLNASSDKYLNAAAGGADVGKKDWSIAGGLASGIAGPAAGLMAASEIINENSKIDSYNAETRAIGMQLYMNNLERRSSSGSRLKKLQEEIEETKMKLVSNLPAEEVIKSLKFSNVRYEISKTGSVEVFAKAEIFGKLNIFGEIPTVIDGSLRAELYQNGALVGNCFLILPQYGVSAPRNLTGICLKVGDKTLPYEVKIVPNRLWYMEK